MPLDPDESTRDDDPIAPESDRRSSADGTPADADPGPDSDRDSHAQPEPTAKPDAAHAQDADNPQPAGGADSAGDAQDAGNGQQRPRGVRDRILALRHSRVFWAAASILFILWIGWARCGVAGCPSVSRLASYQPGGASVLLDRAGNPFADLGPVDHAMVELKSLPDYVPAAFIAVEDRRFYRHHGVDWHRVIGAALANLRAGHTTQGSSTITMQLSRNVFPERIRAADRTIRRKLLEVRVARDIERRFTKDEILELYLNHIYFGGGAYGIEAASRHWFGRAAEDLTLEQAALLAALPKAPSSYDPRRHRERARSRRDLVLGLMAEQRLIDTLTASEAKSHSIRLASGRERREDEPHATYFVQVVREQLEDELGKDLYTRPLRIHTTLDMRAQVAAEEEIEAQIRRVENGVYGRFTGPRRSDWSPGDPQTDYLQGAVVVLDNTTGDVLALVGGRDARQSTFNRAIQAHRQAGSAFKPFVYATALSRGYSTAQWLDDSPYRLVGRDGKSWEPDNYDGRFVGPVTLRDAFVFSRNVPTVRLAGQVGEDNIARMARSAGIDADMIESPVIALGVAEVSPLELTAAYTAFSGRGVAVEPRFVTSVEDADGRVIWQSEVRSHDVLDPGIAYLMTDLMRDVVDRGTGRSVRGAGYDGLVSGKTGTTNDGADTWFVGYTPRVTAGIWVGFDRPRAIAAHASGGSVAGYAWGRMVRRIASWAGGSPWEQPPRVIRVALDPETGLALEDGCEPRRGDARTEIFLRGTVPDETCPERAGGGGSLLGRIGSWVGGLFGGSDDHERRAAPRQPGREDSGVERRRPQPEYRIRRPGPSTESRRDRRNDRRNDDHWAQDLMDEVANALEARRSEQREAIEALRDLKDNLADRLDSESRDRIEHWLDAAVKSVDQAAREQNRTDQRAIEEWLQQRLRQIQRDGRLDESARARLEAEVRRALRSGM